MDYLKQRKQWASRRSEMKRLFLTGWSGPRLAKKYGITVQRVYQLVGPRNNAVVEKVNIESLGK